MDGVRAVFPTFNLRFGSVVLPGYVLQCHRSSVSRYCALQMMRWFCPGG